jgi:uncharacterized protein
MLIAGTYTAFLADRQLVTGELRALLLGCKAALDRGQADALLIFEDRTGRQVEFDFHGTADEVLAREAPPEPAKPGPGRPRLGVVSREVSLLPRHWAYLERQPSGSSAALRRLVEQAIKGVPDRERVRIARESTSRVMTTLAGNAPGYEEAARALFAGDRAKFAREIRHWPEHVRSYLERLSAPSFTDESQSG